MDGNFSMAPSLFNQLYVIRAPLDKTYVTCVYALMAGKTEDEYAELLRAVITACEQLGYDVDPACVTTDFEQPVMSAVRRVLGQNVEQRGCFYHLTQSTWRKVIQGHA